MSEDAEDDKVHFRSKFYGFDALHLQPEGL